MIGCKDIDVDCGYNSKYELPTLGNGSSLAENIVD